MYHDIADFRTFYQTPLGRKAADLILPQLKRLRPSAPGAHILGLGYPLPFLAAWPDAASTVVLFPAERGVHRWPAVGLNTSALVDEAALPIPDAAFEFVLIAHGFEYARSPRAYLREVWRVLVPEGRILLVLPNRRGPWARIDRTPFGHGRPYSRPQVLRMLDDCLFETLATRSALFLPPSERRALIRGLAASEPVGRRLWPNFAGVLMVDARKTLFGAVPTKGKVKPVPTMGTVATG